MMTETVTLRRAIPDDCESLFHWRNDGTVRHFSVDTREIDWDTHQAWFNSSLKNPERLIFIGEAEGRPIGVLRYDLEKSDKETVATVSIYLIPGKHGRGYGTKLLRAGNHWLKEYYPEVTTIHATVLPNNIASQKAFQKAGYSLADSEKDHLLYQINLTGLNV